MRTRYLARLLVNRSRTRSESASAPAKHDTPNERLGASTLLRRSADACACDGGCPRCATESGAMLQKSPDDTLAIGAVDDPLEHEAEAAAEAFDDDALAAGGTSAGTGAMVARSHTSDAAALSHDAAPPSVHSALGTSGHSLDGGVRSEMEEHFETSFDHVRVHTDARAAQSAADVDANAYTVGSHVVFAPGRFTPHEPEGKRLIAHELAHVKQQTAPPNRAIAETHDAVVRRDKTGGTKTKGKQKGKDKPKGPDISKWTFGEVVLKGKAVVELLKSQSIFPSQDNTHVAVDSNGRLGYDPGYTTPFDPFRWQKLKDVVDSKEKIEIDRIGFTDKFKTKIIDGTKSTIVEGTLAMGAAEGVTLPTEALHRRATPTATKMLVSPDADVSHIHCELLAGSASAGPLAHELFGHMWLAIKGVPFEHPNSKDTKAVKEHGTLEAAHGVQTPFGATYTGTVQDFIRNFVSSSAIDPDASPTLLVGPAPLAQQTAILKSDFAKKTTGKLNGAWSVPSDIGFAWKAISRNWEMLGHEPAPAAGTTATFSRQAIEKDVAAFFSTLSPDSQYVFLTFLEDHKNSNIMGAIGLDIELLKTLTKPKGMK